MSIKITFATRKHLKTTREFNFNPEQIEAVRQVIELLTFHEINKADRVKVRALISVGMNSGGIRHLED